MIKFLSGNSIARTLAEMLGVVNRADLAVAYWGDGASTLLGLNNATCELRILCDLRSGACNPDELTQLFHRPNTNIKSKDGLHAKVYLTPNGAVIGSANASANGLGEEANEIDPELEASVLVTDEHVMSDAFRWFENQWKDAEPVDAQSIEKSRPFWEYTRSTPPNRNQSRPTILSVLDSNPTWFRGRRIRLLAYESLEFSPAAARTYKTAAASRYSKKQLAKYEGSGYQPCYEDATGWPIKPGDYILDYHVKGTKIRRATFAGLWRIKHENWFESVGSNRRHRLIFADLVDTAYGLKLPRKESAELGRRIEAILRSVSITEDKHYDLIDLPLNEFVERYFDARGPVSTR